MWPFRSVRRQRYRQPRYYQLPMRRKWMGLVMFALGCALFFQSCGGSEVFSSGGDVSASGSRLEDVSEHADGRVDTEEVNRVDEIAGEHDGDTPTPTPIAVAQPAVPVIGQTVTYATIDGEAITGYLAQPEAASANLPAVIAIHEWWGLNENIEAMARRIAGEGYTVLAVDLYADEVATEPAAAKALLRSVMDNPGPAQDNLSQAERFLRETYSAPTLGVLGWCFGGNWALRASLLLESLDAVVIYYGQLILAPEALDGLRAPVLAFFGENDNSIPVEDVENFEEILVGLGKPADIHLYPDVGHAFANPSGQNYNAAAAEDAWEKTTEFLAAYLS
ncbi:MAG: dienelactone hydrolase family protein [Cyanobacteria bacterium P01_D01_bin.105]